LDNDLVLVKNAKKQPIKCCLLNDAILLWEETEKSLVNRKQGKVHLFEEIINITLKEDNTDDTVILLVKKQEWILGFIPESKIKRDQWVTQFKDAVTNLSSSKETFKNAPKEDDKPPILISTTKETEIVKEPEKEKN